MAGRPERVAILGGDGRLLRNRCPCTRFRLFKGRRSGGNGELRRLVAALRSGGIDRVIILARWNGHAATTRVLRLCRKLGIPVVVVR